jgi:hypothetical protein
MKVVMMNSLAAARRAPSLVIHLITCLKATVLIGVGRRSPARTQYKHSKFSATRNDPQL